MSTVYYNDANVDNVEMGEQDYDGDLDEGIL